ncbi:hypothetical protein JAAARDRAFT_32653 [Jaapia argillacea MUCL 33604]|uniref:Major facilitator superfamily (MFS) profile domain-containing protein n=1 Tax=Jaapia argillacea MUCL 33604 TaxID=933084 RepID=A0A067QCF1_9AGAM|nr:hypothetical protein JAAARDRAFT_32653 [Jaapia argillacea MUCL 33604]
MAVTFGKQCPDQDPPLSIVGAIVVLRFITGVGVGDDRPLSEIISSEFAAVGLCGKLMMAVFAFEGWGNLFGCADYLHGLHH